MAAITRGLQRKTRLDRSEYYDNTRDDIIDLLPANLGATLDVGCGTGRTGQRLLAVGAAECVDGIEIDGRAADIAGQRYRNVWRLDLDTADLDQTVRAHLTTRYDTIMFNDVLEHLRDPWSALSVLATCLKATGLVVVSLPNVQCVEVVAPLLLGRFDYRSSGVLDRTHLRFFTRSSARRLLEHAGLEIVAEGETRVGASRSAVVRAATNAIGPFGVRQLLFLARPVPNARASAALENTNGPRWPMSPSGTSHHHHHDNGQADLG